MHMLATHHTHHTLASMHPCIHAHAHAHASMLTHTLLMLPSDVFLKMSGSTDATFKPDEATQQRLAAYTVTNTCDARTPHAGG